MIAILTEKPSAAKNFAKALGGLDGIYHGEEYRIVNSVGHLFAFPSDPSELVFPSRQRQYKRWSFDNLPWEESDFRWKRVLLPGRQKVLSEIKKGCKDAEEIVIATDNDPSGEGMLIAAEILTALHLEKKPLSRMYFEDESPKSIQKAFRDRKAIPSLQENTEYIKADYRSRWDYLSMQFTRIATLCSPDNTLLRNGRLKSFMNILVGDGLEEYSSYKPSSVLENAFQDEMGVWYTKKENERYPTAEEVPMDGLHPSNVVEDGTKRKSVPPPKLLDLAGLSAILAQKGYKASYVLALYQKMYEDSVVSYPRTEDAGISAEQFRELLGNIDEIAQLVGVDPGLLTHRSMRSTHVGTGFTHGANRPGPSVPSSLRDLDKEYGKGAALIYETLALNTLAMFCEDQILEITSGHVEDFPDYKGSVTNCLSIGFKAIWDTDPEEFSEKKLGTTASPAVREIKSKRPPQPTMKWLMKQLEKYNVGTGATRTSIYADITYDKKWPLLNEEKGKLTLTQLGRHNYNLLKGTNIGSPHLTEQLQTEMKAIGDGKISGADVEKLLQNMKKYVMEDMKTMQKNGNVGNTAQHFEEDQQTPYTCPVCGSPIIRKWWGYDCAARKDGNCGFSIGDEVLEVHIPQEQQVNLITQGATDMIYGFVSKKGTKFNAKLVVDKEQHGTKFEYEPYQSQVIPGLLCPICGGPIHKTSFGLGCSNYRTTGCKFTVSGKLKGKKLTETQMVNLAKGGWVMIKGMTSNKGSKFDAKVRIEVNNGETSLKFSFD